MKLFESGVCFIQQSPRMGTKYQVKLLLRLLCIVPHNGLAKHPIIHCQKLMGIAMSVYKLFMVNMQQVGSLQYCSLCNAAGESKIMAIIIIPPPIIFSLHCPSPFYSNWFYSFIEIFARFFCVWYLNCFHRHVSKLRYRH